MQFGKKYKLAQKSERDVVFVHERKIKLTFSEVSNFNDSSLE